MSISKAHQQQEPKMLGKRENGVSTPLVLSIRPYVYIISNHAKRDISLFMQFTLKTFMHIQQDHTNQ